MEKLINIRDELSEKYQYIKPDQDIFDQMIKVLHSDYDWTKHELKKARRQTLTLELDEVQQELDERYRDFKMEKKKNKKGLIISDDSSDKQNEKA